MDTAAAAADEEEMSLSRAVRRGWKEEERLGGRMGRGENQKQVERVVGRRRDEGRRRGWSLKTTIGGEDGRRRGRQ